MSHVLYYIMSTVRYIRCGDLDQHAAGRPLDTTTTTTTTSTTNNNNYTTSTTNTTNRNALTSMPRVGRLISLAIAGTQEPMSNA